MNRFNFIFGLIVLNLVFKGNNSEVEYKQWKPNTNWHNPSNWAKGKVPCPLQEVRLVSLNPLAVAVSGYTPLHSLSLPLNGELILNKDAELTFFDNDKPNDQCSATGDIDFIADAPKNWHNPANWRVVNTEGNPVPHQNNGLLHLNEIPCLHDQVQFQEESSFLIKSDQQITVASVIMNGQVYTQKTFQEYLGSETGQVQFNLNKASITLTGETCRDTKGCFCNTSQVRETVCSFVKCVKPQCKLPLTPSGSCCSFCGVLLKIKPLSTFSISEFKEQVSRLSNKFLQSRSSQVQFSISRTQDGLVQVVFADFEDGKKAQKFAHQVIDQISGSSQLTIEEQVQSGSVTGSSSKKASSSPLGLSVGLGVGLAVVVLVVIIVILVFKRKRRTRDNYSNSGLQEENRVYFEMMQAKSESTEQLQEPSSKNENLQSNNLLYETSPKRDTFDNPLYEAASHLEREI